jgi:DNA-binding beta-propeller fold protein YncE
MGDGSLQPLSSLSNGLTRPTSIVLSPSGRNAYVVDAGANRVLIFSVNNGFLNQIGSVATGSVPQTIALTPSGHFAYVTNYGPLSNGITQGTTLSQYAVDGAGLLTAMTPITVLAGSSNSAGPFAIAVDQTGSVVLNTNYNENDIALNVIGANGSLSANPVEFFNTNISEPTSIAIY